MFRTSLSTSPRRSWMSRLSRWFNADSRGKSASSSRTRFLPEIEDLEERTLLTNNYLVLDFTPAVHGKSFSTLFSDKGLRNAKGLTGLPMFLDFNGDRKVNGRDMLPGIQAIAQRAAQYLQGFNITVQYGDFQKNTKWGEKFLKWGAQYDSEQVFVVYMGGYSGKDDVRGNSYLFGRSGSLIPPPGFINETFANAWPSSIAKYFQFSPEKPGMQSPAEFIDKVAATAVHEFAHMVGLGHPEQHFPNDPYNNIMNYQADISRAGFPNQWYFSNKVDHSGNIYNDWLNPAQELYGSLNGEPNWRTFGVNHFLDSTSMSNQSGSENNHAGCSCPACSNALMRQDVTANIEDAVPTFPKKAGDLTDTALAASALLGETSLRMKAEVPTSDEGAWNDGISVLAVDLLFSQHKEKEAIEALTPTANAMPLAGEKSEGLIARAGLEDPLGRSTL